MPTDRPEMSIGSYPTIERSNPIGRAIASALDAGREILARRGIGLSPEGSGPAALIKSCHQLLEHRGEASGLALANEITSAYRMLDSAGRQQFFASLASDFGVSEAEIMSAAEGYRDAPGDDNLSRLVKAVEAPRQKLFRRINMVPEGTATLVAMRGQLLPLLRQDPTLAGVDLDMKHLFISWFNKGFLEMRRIDWGSPAIVLEKIIEYEAVHEINGWEDLRSRLAPDRLCYAFFHPAMPNDPLVFVEIALTQGVASKIGPLLEQHREMIEPKLMDTVVFYSISNCHPGLAGVSFGNFLLKHVVEEIHREMPGIKQFVTLSPIPGFLAWLKKEDVTHLVDTRMEASVKQTLETGGEIAVGGSGDDVSPALLKLCAHYLVNARRAELAWDPVARFHLGNGATLFQLNWGADLSAKGLRQSAGIMVNYLYDLNKIEVNHDEYFDQGKISSSKAIRKLL
jgi:malonyl-CoA decarboxylase